MYCRRLKVQLAGSGDPPKTAATNFPTPGRILKEHAAQRGSFEHVQGWNMGRSCFQMISKCAVFLVVETWCPDRASRCRLEAQPAHRGSVLLSAASHASLLGGG